MVLLCIYLPSIPYSGESGKSGNDKTSSKVPVILPSPPVILPLKVVVLFTSRVSVVERSLTVRLPTKEVFPLTSNFVDGTVVPNPTHPPASCIIKTLDPVPT